MNGVAEVLVKEKCGSLGRLMLYVKDQEGNKIIKLNANDTFAKSVKQRGEDLFREIFLPHGYPESVSDDYMDYQLWDSVQAFCSSVTGTFTTQAILKSVGVGDSKATPFAAALTWILKDGTGMVGRILFAWWKGNCLDADCKKWRLFADALNDLAMFLELCVPFFSEFALQVLCVTTSMKAIVGVAGGATRASITQHQAVQGNMADVSAKDSSQETCVNVLASVIGIFLLATIQDGSLQWILFFVFTCVHLLANYSAVCSLKFKHLNCSRLAIVLKTYLRFDTVANPLLVNRKESVFLGWERGIKEICGFDIEIGYPLPLDSAQSAQELTALLQVYENSKYFFIVDMKRRVISVALEKRETAKDVIAAYFYAVLLGIATSNFNGLPMSIYTKRQLHHVTPIMRLHAASRMFIKNPVGDRQRLLPLDQLTAFDDYVNQEIPMFFTSLQVNGWDLNSHSIELGEWRACWKSSSGDPEPSSSLPDSEHRTKLE